MCLPAARNLVRMSYLNRISPNIFPLNACMEKMIEAVCTNRVIRSSCVGIYPLSLYCKLCKKHRFEAPNRQIQLLKYMHLGSKKGGTDQANGLVSAGYKPLHNSSTYRFTDVRVHTIGKCFKTREPLGHNIHEIYLHRKPSPTRRWQP